MVATIKDVARMAGVAPSNISKYMNGGHVREENAKAIREAIETLDYHADPFARGLKTKRNRSVGVLLPDMTAPFYGNVVMALSRAMRERDYHCLSLLYEIFALLRHEALRSTQQTVPRRLRTVLDRINSEFADPELSVEVLAREASISKVYFRQEFKQYAGIAPREYIRRVRLENAQALLGTAVYPVSEVAIRCGFNSISYFSSQFKRMYGVSPSEYMKTKRFIYSLAQKNF